MSRKSWITALGRFALVAIVAASIAAPALAQGTLFVEGDNVGIGVENPTVRLEVMGDGNLSGHFEQGSLVVDRSDGAVANLRFRSTGGAADQSWLFQNNPATLVFAIRNETGAASPFRIFGDAPENNFVARGGNWGLGVGNPTHRIHTNANGAHLNAAGQWVDGSSRVHKSDIQGLSVDEAMTALAGLQPVKWASIYEEDGRQYVGFIAEDVPELVAQPNKDGLSAIEIVSILTRVVQEQQSELAELKARLALIESGNE